jgi:hypothetical protein
MDFRRPKKSVRKRPVSWVHPPDSLQPFALVAARQLSAVGLVVANLLDEVPFSAHRAFVQMGDIVPLVWQQQGGMRRKSLGEEGEVFRQ